MDLILVCLMGYLIGAIPFAFVIGKVFFRTDVRKHGSGNLGGSNTGRVLGKKAGLAVMTLDLLKVTLVLGLTMLLCKHPWAVAASCLCAALGHCYPVFVHFRGGKAVATLYGFLFGLWVCAKMSALVFFLPLITFMVVLFLFKIVSLSSMLSSLAAMAYIWSTDAHVSVKIAAVAFAALIILRHHENIARMLQGNERKIRWM